MKPIGVGLRGFGRVGRNLFRVLYGRDDIRVRAINDIADPEALEYLLRFDTTLGRFPDEAVIRDGHLYTVGRQIPFLSDADSGALDWSELGVDVVIEATARNVERAELEQHLERGAERVVLCVPPRQPPDITVVYGLNDDQLEPRHRIISNASCTAHCAAPILKILADAFGIERAFLNSVHAYTNQQRLADVPAEDSRSGRAAAENIIPQETNSAQVITEILPGLAGKLSGTAMNVPVHNGSVVDLTCWHERPGERAGSQRSRADRDRRQLAGHSRVRDRADRLQRRRAQLLLEHLRLRRHHDPGGQGVEDARLVRQRLGLCSSRRRSARQTAADRSGGRWGDGVMSVRVGINGFGRIGRSVYRILSDRDDITVVGVNDLYDNEQLAYLLRFDTVQGVFDKPVEVAEDHLMVAGERLEMTAERDPRQVPWGDFGVDVVVESTGVFRKRAQLEPHLEAGAKKVVLTVPAKDPIDATVVIGVNDETLDADDRIVSNASCTTNCLAPLAKVLDESFGLVEGFITTVHAYTNGQRLADIPSKNLRRSRAAAQNIIPTTTGAAKAVGQVLPHLDGKLDGMAIRVPVPDGSIVDLVCRLDREVDVAAVNEAMRAAAEGAMKNILQYSDDPLVSSDVIGNAHSSIFDSLSTSSEPGGYLRVLSWYDNEWGYSNRVVDLIEKVAAL